MESITDKTILTARRPISDLPDFGYGPCVYLLFAGEEVVYVGESSWPRERLTQHRKRPLALWDTYALLSCCGTYQQRLVLESSIIARVRPTMNKTYSRKYVREELVRELNVSGNGTPSPRKPSGTRSISS